MGRVALGAGYYMLAKLGMHGLASANYAVEDCDFLIAVGARFDDRVAVKGFAEGKRIAKIILPKDLLASAP